MTQPLLELSGVTVRFGGLVALDEVSLEALAGLGVARTLRGPACSPGSPCCRTSWWAPRGARVRVFRRRCRLPRTDRDDPAVIAAYLGEEAADSG